MKKAFILSLFAPLPLLAQDWPMWGGNQSNNMVSPVTGIPLEMEAGKRIKGSEEVDMATTKNCAYAVKLGSQSYGTPTIAGGRIFVGTNNETPRDEKHQGDRGVVMVFDEATGAFQHQLIAEKLGAGKVSDWEFLGMCSSATIVGDKAFIVTNRCEILCFDVKGHTDGNQGMQDEGAYMAGIYDASAKKAKPGEPMEVGPTDADILWVYDMRGELGVFPHNIASSSVVPVGENIVCTTSNGVDWSHLNIPAPQAPSLISLNMETGELVGEMEPVVSERVLHCSWSSPGFAKVGDKDMILFAAGDGWTYGLSPETKADDEGFELFEEYWRFDNNPPEYREDENGEPIKYAEYDGPSECIGSPVYHDGLVYSVIGQDPEHGEGVGMISCIDPTGEGDLSGKAVWTFKGIERSISTPSIADGICYISDYSGRVFALDAKTGEQFWEFDTKGHIWGSTVVIDGKVLIANEEGEMYILKAGKGADGKPEELGMVEFPAPIYSSPVAANGSLFVATMTHLYCFKEGATGQNPLP